MSYFKTNTALVTKEDEEILNLVMKRCQIDPSMLELETALSYKNDFSRQLF